MPQGQLSSSQGDHVPVEKIADLAGCRTTNVAQSVYRHPLRPMIETGATAMNEIFNRQVKTGRQ